VMVGCGNSHTLLLTPAGRVLSCGFGHFGQLGHCDKANKLVLTLVAVEHLGGPRLSWWRLVGFIAWLWGQRGQCGLGGWQRRAPGAQ